MPPSQYTCMSLVNHKAQSFFLSSPCMLPGPGGACPLSVAATFFFPLNFFSCKFCTIFFMQILYLVKWQNLRCLHCYYAANSVMAFHVACFMFPILVQRTQVTTAAQQVWLRQQSVLAELCWCWVLECTTLAESLLNKHMTIIASQTASCKRQLQRTRYRCCQWHS